jgi:folylpolyglutamate synthase/dihydropteroate synthase
LGKLRLITGRTQGHDVASFYEPLKERITHAYVAKLEFFRTMEPEDVVVQAGLSSATVYGSAKAALEACLNDTKRGDRILVTGSFYLVGEIGNLIKP